MTAPEELPACGASNTNADHRQQQHMRTIAQYVSMSCCGWYEALLMPAAVTTNKCFGAAC